MIWLTHNLFAGEPADLVWIGEDTLWADRPVDAVQIILTGKTALLPEEGDWRERVSDTLALLGASSDHIDWVLCTARRVNNHPEARWPDQLPSEL